MSVSLAFRFLAGRYHATPYGHHVNEGLVEWPPSPWRILRALISVGYTSGAWNSDGPLGPALSLIEQLSSELPRYHVPPSVGAHSRHFMPIGKLDGKTTLVFDTWARVEDQALIVTWPNVSLDKDELSILGDLAGCLNYLGRSESWVEGRIVGASEITPPSNCFPERCGESGYEQVALLAATTVADFEAWRNERLGVALANLPLPEKKPPPKTLLKKRAKAEQTYPVNLLDCLQKDTTWLRSHGWTQPPGSRRVFYWRRSDAVAVGAPKAQRATRHERRVQAMLLSLANVSRNDHALPSVTRTMPQAELLHRALVSVSARNGKTPPPELTGRDESRQRLRGPHRHAHINPLDLDGDGHLDHILIWAPMGLGENAQGAIRAVRNTFTKGGVEPLRLALAAIGTLRDVVQLPGVYGRHIARLISLDSETVWRSLTPFVAPRYIKSRGKNTLEGQVRAELVSRGFPEPIAVRQLAPPTDNLIDAESATKAAVENGKTSWIRFRHFKLARQHGPVPQIACGFAIQLEFDCPVCGPIALGYGSHFGLGLFKQEDSRRTISQAI